MRLEREQQADTYIGDNQRTIEEGAFTFALREHALTASYLFSIYTVNREATLLALCLAHDGHAPEAPASSPPGACMT